MSLVFDVFQCKRDQMKEAISGSIQWTIANWTSQSNEASKRSSSQIVMLVTRFSILVATSIDSLSWFHFISFKLQLVSNFKRKMMNY